MAGTTQAGNLASQLGGSILGSVVGEGMGLLFNGVNNQNQLNQQNALDQLQLGYNEQMSSYNYNQQLQLWQETNYPAQVQELEQAGLNPALLYGGHGAGASATVGSPSGGISGAQAPVMSPMDVAQMTMQSQATQADINLKNAEAANINAKTPQEAPLMNSQIASITQGVQNQQAQQALTEMQTTTQGIQNEIQGKTIDDQIAAIRSASTQVQNTAQQAVRNNYMDQNTMDDKLKTIHGIMLGQFLQNANTQSQTQLTQEQITNLTNQISQGWQQLGINQQNANTASSQQKLQQFIHDLPQSSQILQQGLMKLIPSLYLGL